MNHNTTTYTLITWTSAGNTPEVYITRKWGTLVARGQYWHGYRQSAAKDGVQVYHTLLVDGANAGPRTINRWQEAVHG